MSYTLPQSALLNPIFEHPRLAGVFSDGAFLAKMVEVEVTLAQVQAEMGIIPAGAAQAIKTGATTFEPDIAQLQAGIDKAGIPVPELVRQLRQHIGEAGTHVHWGATTQDILDTALVLQLREACVILGDELGQTITLLAKMAQHHRHTLMVGRTHSQAALPITFGLKAAGWLAPLLRHRERLAELKKRLLVVQFGGAAGTLASLGEQGLAVQKGMAEAFNLGLAPAPWHTQRDTVAEFAGWLALVTSSLSKMAQDIILLAQTEVGEVKESADKSRGGSSTMPQKANPIISEGIIAIGRHNAQLLASLHQAMIQEHERATHGWQLEWLSLPQMCVLTGAALQKAIFLAENLVVNEERMQANVKATHGLMLAEAISLALADEMGREPAKKLVTAACRTAFEQGLHLVDVVQRQTHIGLDWEGLRDEGNYLGEAQVFIDRVLGQI